MRSRLRTLAGLTGAFLLIGINPTQARVPPSTYFASPAAVGTGNCTDQMDACTFSTAVGKTKPGDTVELAGGTYAVTDGFTLSGITVTAEPGTAPIFNGGVIGQSIFGPSGTSVTVDGVTLENTRGAPALVNSASNLELTADRFVDNDASNFRDPGSGYAAAIDDTAGAAIYVTDSTFSGNVAQSGGGVGFGGAIGASGGQLHISDSRFVGNIAAEGLNAVGYGGAIETSNESLVINGSVFSNNIGSKDDTGSTVADSVSGGAILIQPAGMDQAGEVSIAASTFYGNVASTASAGDAAGGALDLSGALTAAIQESTIADNTSDPTQPASPGSLQTEASALLAAPTTTLVASTVVGNDNGPTASGHGAVIGEDVDLAADILAENHHGTQCDVSTITDSGYNRVDDHSCQVSASTSAVSGKLDASLSALHTTDALPTIAISASSPAAGKVPSTAMLPGSDTIPLCSFNDERGVLRPANHCDIGAYERTPVITTSLSSRHRRSRFGWWRAAVTVHFTCAPADRPITCPSAVKRTHAGKDQVVSVSETASGDDAGTASARVTISIDRTKPTVVIKGLKPHKTYRHKPHLRCKAKDALSGVASCKLSTRTRHGVAHVTATATDRAGNKASARRTYRIV